MLGATATAALMPLAARAQTSEVVIGATYPLSGAGAQVGYKPKAIVAQAARFSEKALYDAVADKLEGAITRASFSPDLAAKRPMVGKINELFKAKSGRTSTTTLRGNSWP
jgi:branched-chain amino acid transport system substrate-binding protein